MKITTATGISFINVEGYVFFLSIVGSVYYIGLPVIAHGRDPLVLLLIPFFLPPCALFCGLPGAGSR